MKSIPARRRNAKTSLTDRGSTKGRAPKRADLEPGLEAASQAFEAGREADAVRILEPLTGVAPEVPELRELLGLALYRVGRYAAAAKELEAFSSLAGSTEQHPVLMDCRRAQKRYPEVARLWGVLRSGSQRAAIVMEGRIVMAGSLADQGELGSAIRLLEGATEPKGRVEDHHARLWYALADLEERAGNLARARSLFDRARSHSPNLADVAERLAALS